MLTGDLAMNWRRGDKISPRLIKTDDANYLREAAGLIAIFEQNEGNTRGTLEAALEQYVGFGTDYKIMRGLIKLLLDRCDFETSAVAEPTEVRRALFLAARSVHPIVRNENARLETLSNAAQELNCQPEEILQGLYADLPENQNLV